MKIASLLCLRTIWPMIGVACCITSSTTAAPYTWTPTAAGTFNWDNTGPQDNWGTGSAGPFPNAAADSASLGIALAGNQTVNLNQAITVNSLSFGSNTGAFTTTIAPNGGSLIFDNGGSGATLTRVAGGTGATTISAPIILADNLTVNHNASTFTLNLTGLISDTGSPKSITFLGDAAVNSVLVSGANTYSGDTKVTSGAVQFDNGNSVPDGAGKGNVIVGNGAFFIINANETINGLGGIAGATVRPANVANRTLTLGAGDATGLDFAGALTNRSTRVLTVTKIGTGTQTFSGTNTYTGNTTIKAGTLTVSGSHNTGATLTHYTIGDANGDIGTLNISGTISSTNANSDFKIGGNAASATTDTAIGHVSQTAGTVSTGFFSIAHNFGSGGDYTLSGASSILNVASQLYVGTRSTGTMTQSDGTVNTADFYIGYLAAGTTGTYNLSGGAANVSHQLLVGQTANGIINQTGGSIVATGTDAATPAGPKVVFGDTATGNGTFTQSGGSLTTVSAMAVGNLGVGSVTQSGTGVVTVGSELFIGLHTPAASTSTYLVKDSAQLSTTNGAIDVGGFAKGSLTQQGGTIAANGANGALYLGDAAAAEGTFDQSAGSLSAPIVLVGSFGKGTLNQTGPGTITTPVFSVADQAGSTGAFTVSGATSSLSATTEMYIGTRGTGTMTQSNGSVTTPAFYLGWDATGNGTLTLSNGSIAATVAVVGYGGTGTVNQMGGSVAATDMSIGATNTITLAPGSGTYNLSAGTLDVASGNGRIGRSFGTAATFSFTGGTLKLKEWNPTVASLFSGDLGDLTQTGASSLLNVTANSTTINGNYNLTAGTANVGSGQTLTVTGTTTIASGGTAIGNGTIAGNIVNNGIIAPGNLIGSMTASNNLNFASGGHYAWELGALSTSGAGTNFDFLTVGGNLTLGGTSSLDLSFALLSPSLRPTGGDAFWNASHSWKILDTITNTGALNFNALTGVSGPGTWGVTLGSGADLGDVFLNYAVGMALLTGDVNGDHIVNQLDLNVVFGNWLATGANLAQGDANGDHVINQLDINTITGNWLATGPVEGLSSKSVPEPTSSLLMVLGLSGMIRSRSRSRRSV